MFGLFAGTQLLPEIPGQCEFFVVQSWRLPDYDFHHLDVFINLADQKRQLACVQNRLEHDASLDDSIHDCRLSQTRMEFSVSTGQTLVDYIGPVVWHQSIIQPGANGAQRAKDLFHAVRLTQIDDSTRFDSLS